MKRAFTLPELLIVLVIFSSLCVLLFPLQSHAKQRANQITSSSNLRNLVIANHSYASEHGSYCPAQERMNRIRWHGARSGMKAKFDPSKGFLSPYLGYSLQVAVCPQFKDIMEGTNSFENGSGGYGYNSIYIGGTPADPFSPEKPANISHPARTLMFATTALAKKNGIQEYPFASPFNSVDPDGSLAQPMQPSIHFRFGGKALVAWCDGHISLESPTPSSTVNYYGGSNEKFNIGFTGPNYKNGWWNPRQNQD